MCIRDRSYVIPYGTQIVKSWSFTNPKYLTTVYIPETVVKTGGDSFANQKHKMTNPMTFWVSTKGNCTMNKGTFSSLLSCLLYTSIFLMVPGFIKYIRQEKEYYQRFTDACIYMEQMEGSYRQKKNIREALVDTEELFKQGDMKLSLIHI